VPEIARRFIIFALQTRTLNADRWLPPPELKVPETDLFLENHLLKKEVTPTAI